METGIFLHFIVEASNEEGLLQLRDRFPDLGERQIPERPRIQAWLDAQYPNCRDTPIYRALSHDDWGICQCLLELRANPTLKNRLGRSAQETVKEKLEDALEKRRMYHQIVTDCRTFLTLDDTCRAESSESDASAQIITELNKPENEKGKEPGAEEGRV
ncbi:hypothetical protein QBC44DRAFT_311720 [Cladorrhinum sp. PSN332]|nr:hypothetical protein QBC44DRAFT_311720 [Cladorrhinum sp. PSN332]